MQLILCFTIFILSYLVQADDSLTYVCVHDSGEEVGEILIEADLASAEFLSIYIDNDSKKFVTELSKMHFFLNLMAERIKKLPNYSFRLKIDANGGIAYAENKEQQFSMDVYTSSLFTHGDAPIATYICEHL